MSRKIICFGDSNTYGAHGFSGGRFPENIRWTGMIGGSQNYAVINCGENGREIPTDQWDLAEINNILTQQMPIDLLVIMLGSNDLLTMFRSGADKVTVRMEAFLQKIITHPAIGNDPKKILLIAPPPTEIGRAYEDDRYDAISRELGTAYAALARTMKIYFADAGKWGIELGTDGVHLTEKGHRTFAAYIEKIIDNILLNR